MSTDANPSPPLPDPGRNAAERYRVALRRTPSTALAAILQTLDSLDRSARPVDLAGLIFEKLEETRFVEGLIGRMSHASRMMLGLFTVIESAGWPMPGLNRAMRMLGADPVAAIAECQSFGPVVTMTEADGTNETILSHPTVLSAARTVAPEPPTPPTAGSVRQVREGDALEPILRLAALWQRVEADPLRRTQGGSLYKKDRERVEDDPVLAGPIADALEPLPDPATLWLTLALSVGLIVDERGTDRTLAVPAEYWADNALHLPQMLASRWFATRVWDEIGGGMAAEISAPLAAPSIRLAALLWLAAVEPGSWVAIDDLAAHFDGLHEGWASPFLTTIEPSADYPRRRRIPNGAKGMARAAEPAPELPGGVAVLEAILLGPAYQLGLIRAAEEDPSGRRVVALTDLGRYTLALGRSPAPRETFPGFLFVQPNFEVIAYRQGLNPSLIGTLSRFMTWTQSGAALEMKLTPESVYRGLEGGLTPEAMLGRLAKHSARPLSPGVAEAIRTWSSRRDRVTYFTSGTLVEFPSAEALEDGLAAFASDGRTMPARVSDRVLLVEDESTIPFASFKLAGSRDYTRPPEICVTAEPDGVTLSIDLARSDLFIDAELSRFADLVPDDGRSGPARRRYRASPESLRRAVGDGFSAALLSRWFAQRAGAEVPPALRLLVHAAGSKPEPFGVAARIVLTAPTSDLLEGLIQHPATRGLLGPRLGPSTVEIPSDNVDPLREALARFGLDLQGPAEPL